MEGRAISVPLSQAIDRISPPAGRPFVPYRIMQGVAIARGKVQHPDRPGLPLDEGADRRALVLADDEVPLRKTEGAREGRVWLRSPCVTVAHWECSPGSSGCPGC